MGISARVHCPCRWFSGRLIHFPLRYVTLLRCFVTFFIGERSWREVLGICWFSFCSSLGISAGAVLTRRATILNPGGIRGRWGLFVLEYFSFLAGFIRTRSIQLGICISRGHSHRSRHFPLVAGFFICQYCIFCYYWLDVVSVSPLFRRVRL